MNCIASSLQELSNEIRVGIDFSTRSLAITSGSDTKDDDTQNDPGYITNRFEVEPERFGKKGKNISY